MWFKNGEGISLEKQVLENYYKIYSERAELFKSFGYDIDKERSFLIEKAQPVYGKVLEIGTGKGYLTFALAERNYNFTTIDISKETQQFARQIIKYCNLEKNVDFRIEDARNLNFKDRSFDTIFSANTLHHLEHPLEVMDELLRILTAGGKIILSDFSKEGLKIINKIHKQDGRMHTKPKIDLDDLEKYFLNNSFKLKVYKTRVQKILIASD